MSRAGALVFGSLSLLAHTEQGGLAPDVLLLARIKVNMAGNLAGLPNYTCLETIERFRRRAPSRRAELIDALRLEVALVKGKELFSYPGAEKFEERELRDFVPGGVIGNGVFALHARNVFLSSSPRFTYIGEREDAGRRQVGFEFTVSQTTSGYTIRVGAVSGITAYHGSFWADADTLDLIRLDVIAHDIPPHIPLAGSTTSMEYARVGIGESQFLLPRRGEMTMVDLNGNEGRNVTTFTGCRQYVGESVVRFVDPPPEAPAASSSKADVNLPEGLLFYSRLESAIEFGRTAVGDRFSVVLDAPLKSKGFVHLPKGARLTGRVLQMERRQAGADYYAVVLDLKEVETESVRGRIRARLVEAGNPTRGTVTVAKPGEPVRIGRILVDTRPQPAERAAGSLFYVIDSSLKLPRGFRMVWQTGPQE